VVKSVYLAAVAVTLLLSGCADPSAPPPEPSEVVENFFTGYRGDFREADRTALSASLGEAITQAAATEDESRAAVLASLYPSDKPLLLEGELFSGLYEGFNGFNVGEAVVENGRAAVEVNFTNSHYGVGWVDRVDLVDENGWKIDDVRYLDKKTGALGLRDVLRDFQEAAAQDPLLNPPQP